MTHRLAVAFAVALLAASPALGQMEPGRELELGGGWFKSLDIHDLSHGWSSPSVDLAWTTWRNERTGIAVGTSILGSNVAYGHVTWRWRWEDIDGRGFFHIGAGAGPWLFRESSPVVKSDPERQTWSYTGETEHRLGLLFLWHVELMVTRPCGTGSTCALASVPHRCCTCHYPHIRS